METSPNRPSIRKHFLTKIYKRSPQRSQDSSYIEDHPTNFNENSSFSSQKSETGQSWGTPSRIERRSGTPGVHSRVRTTDSQSKEPMSIFVDFLTELLRSNGCISESITTQIYSVTKALNDNFAKNPEFSLQFYIAMSEILNALNDLDAGSFIDLQNKVEEALSLTKDGITEMEQLTVLKKHITKINLKVITTLKRFLTVKEEIQSLSFAFLVFFSNADKDIEVSPNKKIPPTSVLSVMQKYTLMPGKMIQTCRKVVEFIHKKLIPNTSVKSSQEILSKINQQTLMEIDRSGGMLILHDFLKACFAYYWAYTQEKQRTSSPGPLGLDRKIIEVEESEPDLRVSTSTPVKMKTKVSLESQTGRMNKSESTKSFEGKEAFDGVIEEKFKRFLRGWKMMDLGKVGNRLMVVDEFEREIRMEMREMFLDRFVSEKGLRMEMEKLV